MVYFLLADGFEETEAIAPFDMVKRAGEDAALVSVSENLTVTGAHGVKIIADMYLKDVSAEKGKISAGIKGVKKASARLKFAAQPFCFAEYILTGKGDKFTVIGASENESFYELRNDLNKFYSACAVCEAASALSYENQEDNKVFYCALSALTQMCNGDESLALIKFLLDALREAGYGISLDNCIECGSNLLNEQKMRFDFNAGAFSCWDCGKGEGASLVTYNVLRSVAGKEYKPECITPDGKKRALRLLREYVTFKTDAKLLSLSEFIRLI